MSVESTVLLVREGGVSNSLEQELERQGLFVEVTSPSDLVGTFPVVSPDLVVHEGAARAKDSVAFLSQQTGDRRVRLVVVVGRAHLAEMRLLDRKIVLSVLGNDMPAKILGDRIATLSRKGSVETATSLGPVPSEMKASPSPVLKNYTGPTPSLAPGIPRPISNPLLTTIPESDDAPLTVRREPTSSPSPRDHVVLVDDDVTRAEAISAALRARGFVVLTVPGDPAKTRWEMLRKFAPHVIVTNTEPAPSLTFYEVLGADTHLKSAERVSLRFASLFDDARGTLELGPLLQRMGPPSGRGAQPDELDGIVDDEDRPTLILDRDDRPTLPRTNPPVDGAAAAPPPFGPPPLPLLDTTPTVITAPNEPPSTQPRGASAPVHAVVEPIVSPPLAVEPVSSGPVTLGTQAPASSPRRTPWVLALGVLAAGGAVGFWATGGFRTDATPAAHAPGETKASPASSPQATTATQAPATSAAAAPPAPGSSIPSSGAADLWKRTDDPAVLTCEALVESKSDLRSGDIAQASQFWDKARASLVLGDSKTAQAHMCRAVTIHPPSLAAEGLAENLLVRHAPEQASRWVQEGLKHRPGRPKTLELLGDIESQRGRVEEARAAWAAALGVAASEEKTLALVARQYATEAGAALRSKNLVRAEILFRRAATLIPTSADAAAGLARVFYEQKEDARGDLWLAEAFRRQADAVDAWILKAERAALRGDTKEALGAYERALESNPNHWHAREAHARLKKSSGE